MEKQRAAAAIQRESVRKQVEMAAPWRGAEPPAESVTEPAAEPAAVPECATIPETELTPLIDSAAQGNQLETRLLRGVIEQESAKRPCAVSVKGAKGLMQLMPATIEQFQVEDPFDAKQNIAAGAKYLRQLIDRYQGDIKLALAAYNSGPGTVDQAGAIPEIKETRDYVEAILKKLK
jgi:soluble lytic murein transglycosylase-like protein